MRTPRRRQSRRQLCDARLRAKPGRFTVIGSLLPSTLCIRYTHPESYVTLQRGASGPRRESVPDWHLGLARRIHAIWTVQHLDTKMYLSGRTCGYLSYELGVAELGVPLNIG